MTLSTYIRQAREAKPMTQLELAKKLGYDSSMFVCLMEAGKSKIPLPVLGKLIVILGLDEKSIVKQLKDEYEKKMKHEIGEGKRGAK